MTRTTTGNTAALTAAVAAIPGNYRRKVLVCLTGPASPTNPSNTSPPSAGSRGRSCTFPVGWSCIDREIDAIDNAPTLHHTTRSTYPITTRRSRTP